ncbi:MAG: phosphohistidine phosphatase SixA [Desulfobacteraceae bacterium]|jgi:phosphohistidine phosphatase
MRIYLMQHGEPVPKEEDPDRPLSEQGKRDVGRMSGFLGKSGLKVQEALHSGKTRSRQTAEIMVSQLNPEIKAQERAGLSPLDDVKEIAGQIKDVDKDLLIAGHLPHLGKLASLLITGDEEVPVVSFQQGGVVCLERDEKGHWSVAWMVVPEIIKDSV